MTIDFLVFWFGISLASILTFGALVAGALIAAAAFGLGGDNDD